MNYPFTHIAIIYNPNSTGDGPAKAKKLQSQLKEQLPAFIKIDLTPTKSAGHAEELAREYAQAHKECLIVSVSGDGGYNEVINGVLKSGNEQAISIVLPSGNANDHDRAISNKDFLQRILKPKVISIDAIKVDATKDGAPFTRYAHSYVGMGLTAYVGKKLTEADLNPVNEKWLALKYMVLFRSVSLKIGRQPWHRYSSVIYSTIGQMSKIIKLSTDAKLADGIMECYEHRARSTMSMIFSLLLGSTVGFKPTAQLKKQAVISRRSLEVQFDGEVVTLDSGTKIVVGLERAVVCALK